MQHKCVQGRRGAGGYKKSNSVGNFFPDVIFAKGMRLKINAFFAFHFIYGGQHLVPRIRYFRRILGFVRYLQFPKCLENGPLWD